MRDNQRTELVDLLRKHIPDDDPAHDIYHIFRVLKLSENIGKMKGADMDIVIPVALFHDLVTYPKSDPRNVNATAESAEKAGELLQNLSWYPKDKIEKVKSCIKLISFSKGEKANSLESMVVQDADMLEATGAISIMRTFAYSGKINRLFYHPTDPYAKNRELDDMKYSIDLFYTRLLKVKDRMNTEIGKRIAKRRTKFLQDFLKELELELEGK